MDILNEGRNVFKKEIETLNYIKDNLNESFIELVELIQETKGRVIITGMGKAGHIGKKVSATMSSLGIISFFLHPAEGLHGDLGIVSSEDIIIVFSKSGETDEVLGLIPSIKNIGAKIVSITCRETSSLSDESDLKIMLPILEEASAYQLAPTTSTTAMLVFGDALAIVLSKLKGFTPDDFAVFHPSGSLGKKLLLRVENLMKRDEENATVLTGATLKEAIVEMSKKGLGAVSIIDQDKKLKGILTDGDLRRIFEKLDTIDILNKKVDELMIKNPIFVQYNEKAVEVLELMENRKKQLSVVPVVNEKGTVVGMLRVHDIIKAGIV
jgi:arabinose-5-phosphate isomerase